jgi:CDP-diacylglycerol--glycerol-3-phosphate 3-phosphatidyltransferase
MDKNEIFTIPNFISFLRLLSLPLLLYFVWIGNVEAFKWLLLGGLLSDILDGWIARRFKMETALGALLDGTADTGMIVCAIFGIMKFQMPFVREHLVEICILIGGFILARIINVIRYKKIANSFHTYLAKAQAYVMGAFIMTLFLFGYQAYLFYPAFMLMLAHTIEECIMLILIPEDRPNIKGLYWYLKEGVEKN